MLNWDQIVADYGPIVVHIARRVLGPGPDAEDVVQEVFLEVFQLRQRETVVNWTGLLRRIATHRALDCLRRRRRTDPLGGVESPDARESAFESAVASELADRLRTAIARLPDRQAAVFSLRYFDERSYDEIAEILGIQRGAVGAALHKARLNLQSRLEIQVKGTES